MKLFDLHADLGYAVAKKRKEGHSRVLSSFYTDALRKGGIKAVFMAAGLTAPRTLSKCVP